MAKERNQNLLNNDTVRLKFFTFNGGDYSDPHEVQKVDIYKLFSVESTDENPLGREIIETIEKASIVKDGTGKYHIDVNLTYPTYTQGRYQDEWSVVFEEDTPVAKSFMDFMIYPNTWFTDSMPVVHNFNFDFKPNKIVKGSKQYIEVKVIPNVPRGTDKQRYYENMARAGELFISIEQTCGDCLPQERDLRLLIEKELITERDGCAGYYLFDTTELECGLYDIWFQANLGPNVYISEKQPLQIYS